MGRSIKKGPYADEKLLIPSVLLALMLERMRG